MGLSARQGGNPSVKGRKKIQKVQSALDAAVHNSTEDYDSIKWLTERSSDVDKNLLAACARGSPAALTTFYKVTGKLVDKQEQKIDISFSAADHLRIHEEAQKRVKEFDPKQLKQPKVIDIKPGVIKETAPVDNNSDFPF